MRYSTYTLPTLISANKHDTLRQGLGMNDPFREQDFVTRFEAAFAEMDPRLGEILAGHAAIEREIDIMLERTLPAARRLKGLGFGHKIGLWGACMDEGNKAVDNILPAFVKLNDLRNAVAHGDKRALVDRKIAALLVALPIRQVSDEYSLTRAVGFMLGVVAVSARRLRNTADDDET